MNQSGVVLEVVSADLALDLADGFLDLRIGLSYPFQLALQLLLLLLQMPVLGL